MGKRSRRLKRYYESLAKKEGIAGGLVGVFHRNSNGQATMKDADFLTRVKRELLGKDGYTDMNKSNGHYSNQSGQGNYSFRTYQPKEDGVFHCAEAKEIATQCPLNPPVPDILIPHTMWACFMACAKEYDTEWIALLKGKLDKDDSNKDAYIIESFYFPPQNASGAHVDVPTGVRPKAGTIGAIHSHVGMGVFWSGTDTEHSNWPVEIVINRNENYEALARFQLKCGEWAKGKSTVYLTGSHVSQAIDKLVKTAFSSGATLAQAARSTTIPPTIHPDDKAEVASAIVQIACPSCKSAAKYVRIGPCSDPWHSTTIEPTYCQTPECTRYNKHVGWHCRGDGTYFRTENGKIVQDDRNETKSNPTGKVTAIVPTTTPSVTNPTPNSTNSEITVPVGDDPTIAIEEYCQDCEGEGYVETFTIAGHCTDKCPTCKGDGLTELGRIRRAETGSLLS